jgi:26S proteasome regulatory subunit N10
MLCQAKMQSHPENTVGLLTSAGKSARILISATQDLGKVFSCMHDVQLSGTADIVGSIQKAQLALKHRQNPVQRQRIVVFVSSPVEVDEEALVKLGKKLKKNSVAVDIVHVSDDTEGANVAKLDAFIAAVNSSDNSHILHVPAGGLVLADALMSSEIYADRDSGGGGSGSASGGGDGGGGGGNAFEFGVDPAVDPELAMVLRISMEEERARQEATSGGSGGGGGGGSGDVVTAETPASGGAVSAAATAGDTAYDEDADLYGTDAPADGGDMEVDDGNEEMDEDAMLAQAIAMSQADPSANGAATGKGHLSATAVPTAAATEDEEDEEEDEEMDEEMRQAIEMSKADFDEEKKA